MNDFPSIFVMSNAQPQSGAESIFRSGGQTKQYQSRPHITTATPQGSTPAAAPKRGHRGKQ